MSPALLLLAPVLAAPPVADLTVPPGFTVNLVADNALVPDTYMMTIDDAGRVLVAGRGYVRVLADENGDGTADRAIDLIDGLKDGPMGLFAEGDSLYVVADGGLKRYRGYDGKSKLTNPETLLALKTGGEHDAHAVRRGPDGWLYVLCGNMAGVTKKTITGSRSPVKDPVAGVLLRISPDGKHVEVVADGFRNPYDFDFNLDGEPFAYDSDNERCVGLPWYEPCRFYHVVPGGNYGWRSPQLGQFWRKPPYFPDCVAPVCYLGRGSPTGVACYRHTHFPTKYRGGFFLADWTFGRIHFVPLTEHYSTYRGKPEVFAEAAGTSGFAPTGLAVHPKTGELYVSIGGRGTRGGVYRIAHDKCPPGEPLPVAKRSLDWNAAAAKQWLADCKPGWFGNWDLRARRTALDLMARWHEKMKWGEPLFAAVRPNLSHPAPLIRMAGGRVAEALVVPVGDPPRNGPPTAAQLTVALVSVAENRDWSLRVALATLADQHVSEQELLTALRIVHLVYGDLTAKDAAGTVWEGYTFRDPVPREQAARIRVRLTDMIHRWGASQTRAVDLETARLLAALGGEFDPPTHWATLRRIGPDTAPADDFHYLVALARTTVGPAADQRDIADALFAFQRKVLDRNVTLDRNWPLRFDEVLEELRKNWPSMGGWVLKHPDFGRPEHVVYLRTLWIDREAATRKFLAAAGKDADYAWTPRLVALLVNLPDAERRPHLLKLWERETLRDAILKVLPPRPGDQPKFVVGLGSLDPEVVRLSAAALEKLAEADRTTELAAAVKALRRLAPEDKAARAAVVVFLQKRTGEKIGDGPKAWAEWLTKNEPDVAKLLVTADGFDPIAWKKREANIPWGQGDVTRGRAAFAKASCAACHDTGRAVGPSLLGVGKRFGRDDLLTTILQPGKDVSPRYRPTRVTTVDEQVFVGMIVYEATDGVILQTDADTTVRVTGDKIASKKPVDASLMPAGLLDKLTDAEVADLFAYLKSLDEPKPK